MPARPKETWVPLRRRLVIALVPALLLVLGAAAPAASAASRIVFTKERDVWTILPSGEGLRRLTRDDAWQHDVAWSPDRRRIAYVEGGRTVMVMDRRGHARRELFRVPDRFEEVDSLTWSPRGNHVAFASARYIDVPRGIRDCGQVWIVRVRDARARPIVTREPHVTGVSWSPGGTWLAVGFEHQNMTVACGGDAPLGIATVRRDGSGLHGLGVRFGTDPDWAPDGTPIVYRDWRHTCHICGEVWTVRPNGKDDELLARPPTEEGGLTSPRYSPSGRRLAARGDGLWILRADGTILRRIARHVETIDW
ncbi:MAG TPA: hypothetical protein VLA82_13960 [Actinomycetota bacterium]|nr:hypothetical protein [Actinomycetota bacterium]